MITKFGYKKQDFLTKKPKFTSLITPWRYRAETMRTESKRCFVQ